MFLLRTSRWRADFTSIEEFRPSIVFLALDLVVRSAIAGCPFLTVKQLGFYSSLTEAIVACSRLHASGINAQIRDEEAHRSGLLAGQPVILIVAEEDYLAAEAIIQQPMRSDGPRSRTLAAFVLSFGIATPATYVILTTLFARPHGADLRVLQSVSVGVFLAAIAAWCSKRFD